MGTTIWSPLASGLLTGKYNEGIPDDARLNRDELSWLKDKTVVENNLQKIRQLGDFAKEIGMSLPNLALSWCIKNPNVSTAILGASKTSQLLENIKSSELKGNLTEEVMLKIEEILNNKPIHPQF